MARAIIVTAKQVPRKRITYINVLRNMSVRCDCAGTKAPAPTMRDIGILASSDLLAIDQAACDLVFAAPDGKDLIERIESRHGLRQLSAMAEKRWAIRNMSLLC